MQDWENPACALYVLTVHLPQLARPLVALVAACRLAGRAVGARAVDPRVLAGQLAHAQSTRVFWRREPAGHVAPAAARLPGHVEQTGAPWLEKKP